jgi:energy-converting hydrogenase Eha subunit B
MPGGFSVTPPGLCAPSEVGTNLTNGYVQGTTCSPSASANTKGAWAQLIAASAIDGDAIMLRVDFKQTDATTASMLLDIGIGSAGQERVVIPNLFHRSMQFDTLPFNIMLPLHIAAGTRIAARCQSSNAASGGGVVVALTQYAANWNVNEGVSGYDAITTLSGSPPVATQITCSVAGTKTAWTQVNAATSRDYCGVLVMCGNNAAPDQTTFSGVSVDVSIGGAGVEQVLISNISFSHALGVQPASVIFVPVDIPAGSRVAVRASQTGITGGFNVSGVCLYGAYQ